MTEQASEESMNEVVEGLKEVSKSMPLVSIPVIAASAILAFTISNTDFSGKPEIHCPIDPSLGNTTQQFRACVNDKTRLIEAQGADIDDYRFVPASTKPYAPH